MTDAHRGRGGVNRGGGGVVRFALTLRIRGRHFAVVHYLVKDVDFALFGVVQLLQMTPLPLDDDSSFLRHAKLIDKYDVCRVRRESFLLGHLETSYPVKVASV